MHVFSWVKIFCFWCTFEICRCTRIFASLWLLRFQTVIICLFAGSFSWIVAGLSERGVGLSAKSCGAFREPRCKRLIHQIPGTVSSFCATDNDVPSCPFSFVRPAMIRWWELAVRIPNLLKPQLGGSLAQNSPKFTAKRTKNSWNCWIPYGWDPAFSWWLAEWRKTLLFAIVQGVLVFQFLFVFDSNIISPPPCRFVLYFLPFGEPSFLCSLGPIFCKF